MADATDPLATVEELVARCDWTFDDDEMRSAPGYLEEASDLVRAFGRNWSPDNCPRLAKNIVISAARRFMRNPEGLMQSRAGDETLAWRDAGENSGSITLTKGEQKLIRDLAGTAGIHSVNLSAWGPQRPHRGRETPVGFVPVSGYDSEKPFPLYADVVEPW